MPNFGQELDNAQQSPLSTRSLWMVLSKLRWVNRPLCSQNRSTPVILIRYEWRRTMKLAVDLTPRGRLKWSYLQVCVCACGIHCNIAT